MLAAIGEARASAADGTPLTSLERELAATSALRAQPGTVRAVRPLTPTLLELDVDGLDDMVQVAPDTFVYVMVAVDGTSIDPGFTIQDFSAQPEGGPVRGAYYTIRRRDPETGVVTFWVVLHDHAGGVGGWMQAARPGDQVVGWGPRPGFAPSPEAEAVLLVADETGWAAAAAIIESLPADVEVVARLEAGDPSGTPPMPTHPRLDLQWVVRAGEPGTGDELLDAVAAVDLGDPSRWAAFGGAESRQISRVRRLVRRERGLAAARVLMTGYWRRDAVPSSAALGLEGHREVAEGLAEVAERGTDGARAGARGVALADVAHRGEERLERVADGGDLVAGLVAGGVGQGLDVVGDGLHGVTEGVGAVVHDVDVAEGREGRVELGARVAHGGLAGSLVVGGIVAVVAARAEREEAGSGHCRDRGSTGGPTAHHRVLGHGSILAPFVVGRPRSTRGE